MCKGMNNLPFFFLIGTKMKVTVNAGLPAIRNMKIDTCQSEQKYDAGCHEAQQLKPVCKGRKSCEIQKFKNPEIFKDFKNNRYFSSRLNFKHKV